MIKRYYKYIKQRTFDILNRDEADDYLSLFFNSFIFILIILNVIAIVLSSFNTLFVRYQEWFYYFEVFSIVIFTVEYIGRIWTADYLYSSHKHWRSRLKYIFTPLAVIDLLAILPFYLPMIFPFDLRFLRTLRLIRIVRIFKLHRYSGALNIIEKVVIDRSGELGVAFFAAFLLLFVFAILMYYLEHDAQPDKFANVVESFWWVISSISAAKYVAFNPVTIPGRVLGAIISVLAIGFIAVPAGILSSGFIRELGKSDESDAQKKTQDEK